MQSHPAKPDFNGVVTMLYKIDKSKTALYHSRKISIPVIARLWNARKAARQAGTKGISAFVLRIQSHIRSEPALRKHSTVA